MTEMVKLALLLRPEHRKPGSVARVEELAGSLGLRATGSGRTTVSAELSLDAFVALFGSPPTRVPPSPPGARDFGRAGGFEADRPLAVPEALAPYVESITVTPPAHRLY
jgi:hypothetical protein